MELSGVCGELFQEVHGVADLVLRFLTDEEFHPVRIIVADVIFQHIDPAVLAAEPQDEHAACVRMVDQVCEDLAGVLLVVAHLGASVRMGKGGDSFDRAGNQGLRLLLNGCGNVVDAAHGRDDPELVAHGSASVGPAEALEEPLFRGRSLRDLPVVGVGQQVAQPGLDIMDMYPLPGQDLLFGDADGTAVFDDLSALRDLFQGELVSLGDVL